MASFRPRQYSCIKYFLFMNICCVQCSLYMYCQVGEHFNWELRDLWFSLMFLHKPVFQNSNRVDKKTDTRIKHYIGLCLCILYIWSLACSIIHSNNEQTVNKQVHKLINCLFNTAWYSHIYSVPNFETPRWNPLEVNRHRNTHTFCDYSRKMLKLTPFHLCTFGSLIRYPSKICITGNIITGK